MGNILNIINVPFGMLMSFFYGIFGNYALTLIFFTIAVQIVLLPLGIKQQRNQIRMAQIRPKEQVIRKKYAGRKDTATQQKMQQEVMAMYKQENYSPMSGCLPMLIQLPIIIALYNIVRHPLTYIAGFSSELVDKIKELIIANYEKYNDFVSMTLTEDMALRNLQEIDVVKIFMEDFAAIKSQLLSGGFLSDISSEQVNLFSNFERMNFDFFGQSLLIAPSENIWSILLLIPILNFAAVFLQTRLTRKIQANSALGDAANNKSMKIMEYTMPLMIVYFTYIMSSALGLYWIYRSIVSIIQTLVLAKVFPIPEVTEEQLKLAEKKYGSAKKKKKKKPAAVSSGDSNDDEDSDDKSDKSDDKFDASDESENNLEKNIEKTENNLKKAKKNQNDDDIYNDAQNSGANDSISKEKDEQKKEKKEVENERKNEVSEKKNQKTKKYTVKRRKIDSDNEK
jgi:YidC/Oxa1 family membrane protein insertase